MVSSAMRLRCVVRSEHRLAPVLVKYEVEEMVLLNKEDLLLI